MYLKYKCSLDIVLSRYIIVFGNQKPKIKGALYFNCPGARISWLSPDASWLYLKQWLQITDNKHCSAQK